MRYLLLLSYVWCWIVISASWCGKSTNLPFDAERMMRDLHVLTQEPHPFGSERQKLVAAYIQSEVNKAGARFESLDFEATVPKPQPVSVMDLTEKRQGRNLFALPGQRQADCIVLLGSHYDTKVIEGLNYVGANDSGSSTVVLLEILRHIKPDTACDVGFVWFDGEESTLPGWYDGESQHPARIVDNTYGSRHFVDHHLRNKRLQFLPWKPELVALIVLDMVGHKNLQFSREQHSHPLLIKWRDEILHAMGHAQRIAKDWKAIEDDHFPFIKAGIPAIDLIDFENVYEWHAAGDQISLISPDNLIVSATLGAELATRAASRSKELAR